MRNLTWIAVFLVCIAAQLGAQENEARLMRFPTIHGNNIVFSYSGDLYTVSSEGGLARQLTSDKGYEMFPKFSPDGKTIAFTGQYDGNTEVFKMPALGGIPQRLTVTATLSRDLISDRMGPNNIVMAWTPDGNAITYRSRMKSFNDFKGNLFNVSLNGGLSEELPLAEGGFCSYSPDGSKLAFNRVFREFRTWKYYKGGMADDIWVFDFNTKEVKNITNNASQDIFPMWSGNNVFFLSDRDRTMNLFMVDLETEKTTKVTDFNDFDIKFPSIGGDFIVFEKGGYIYKVNVNTLHSEKVPIMIMNDFAWSRNEIKDASKSIRNADLSPHGERVIFSARGEIFNVPTKKGVTLNLTKTPGAHERDAVWSPDGQFVAYLSDASGEFEVYIQQQDGLNKPIQLTTGATSYMFDVIWSPDSKKIMWTDRELNLRYVDIATKKVTNVYKGDDMIYQYSWSPDSKWIAFTRFSENKFTIISVYNTDTQKINNITDNWYESNSPRFSADGRYIVFISARDFNPTYSETEWNHIYQNMNRVYLALLTKDVISPFALENDTVVINVEKTDISVKDKNKKEKDQDSKEPVKVNVKIDFDNIQNRIISLPIEASNYENAYVVGEKVYYSKFTDDSQTAMLYNLKKKEEITLGKLKFTLSADNKKMLVADKDKYEVIDLPDASVTIKKPIDLSNMKVMVDYAKEWKQIYDESWRQMRDFFYVKNMHGLDWKAMHDKYAALLPYAHHRHDLTYIIGELIGELSVGHAYVQSGDAPSPERIKTGLLGAELVHDNTGFYQIKRILPGENWSEQLRSPLLAPGLNIKVGEYIVAINGESTASMENIYTSLIGKANAEVLISINTTASLSGARTVIVKTIADESELYYYNWVSENIKKVNEATNGEVGYIHVPDMGQKGLTEFAKYYYPQLTKKGLIIDDRGNGGGNVSPMIIERLQREAYRATMRRNIPSPEAVPQGTQVGPKVMLIDKYSASDGDLFPYAFKHNKIGTVIGKRTWGGVVGISGSLPFMDGADLRKPEFASYSSEESKWIIEGFGVEPDIEIDNNPYQEYIGNDAQLQKAIEVIKKQVKENYKPLPAIPTEPDKSK